MFYALVIKKPGLTDDEASASLDPDEEWLHKHHTGDKDLSPEDIRRLEAKRANVPAPPNWDFLQAAREER